MIRLLAACLVLVVCPVFAAPDATVGKTEVEAWQEDAAVLVPVVLSPAPNSSTTIQWEAQNGTAKWPNDYSNTGGFLTFKAGETTKNIVIGLKTAPEITSPKTFTVNLQAGSDYNVIQPFVCTVTIVPNTTPRPTPTPTPQPTPDPGVVVAPPAIGIKTVVKGKGRRVLVTATAVDGFGQTTTRRTTVRVKQ